MAHRADALNRRGRWPIGPVLVVLVVLELAWLAWILTQPLPNAKSPTGQPVSRGLLMAVALPDVVPGVGWNESLIGQAVWELSHVENLPQRVPIALAACLIAAAAVALGRLVLRGLRVFPHLTAWERLPLAFGLGTIGLGLTTLVLGRLGLLDPWPFRLGLGGLIAAELVASLASPRPPATDPRPPTTGLRPWALLGFALVTGPFLVVMALGAMLPTVDFDALEYHLQGPKEYYQAGRIAFLPHNVYTSMPFGVEMLHLLGMLVLGDWWWGALAGQLVVALFAPMAAALVAWVALRVASGRAAWVAAVVYLTTPWIYRMAVLPYVEGPLCFFHAALVWAVWKTLDTEDPSIRVRFWGLVGLLAGGAMACKYPALISAVVPFGLLAVVDGVRRRSLGPIVLAFGLGVAVAVGPWLIKNVIDTGNPVYPLAYSVFGGRHWDEALDAKWRAGHSRGPIALPLLVGSILDVAGRSDWQSPLFAALAPLAWLRRGSRREALVLWGYVAYIFLTWWLLTHRLDRFWLPLLPALAVLAGVGADWVRHRAWSVLLGAVLTVGIATNLVYVSTALAGGYNEWTADLFELRTRIPAESNLPLARLDAELGPGDTALLVGPAAVFHMENAIVYNTVFNHDTFETLARDRSPEQLHRALAEHGITHVYVDWAEIARYRSPGNYGFTPFVQPEVFARLVASGVLEPPVHLGPRHELYRVRSLSGPRS